MAVLIGATNGGYMVLVPPQSGATATVSALVNKDGSGNVAVPTEQYIQNSSGLYVPVSSANPLPAVLTGSNAPLTAAAPTLVLTLAYTNFSASSTNYTTMAGKFTRNARQRTLTIRNTLNEAIGAINVSAGDSTIQNNSFSQTVQLASSLPPTEPGTWTSEQYGMLASHTDSLELSMAMGSTAPTSGNVYIYMTEVF